MDSEVKNFRFAEAVVLTSTDYTPARNSVIYVGGGGDSKTLKVTSIDGSVITFTGIQTGTIIPLLVKLVWKTGTDATNLVALSD